ncbi:hypothetical protein AAY473_021118, partial [Plecturocebus cupreus]
MGCHYAAQAGLKLLSSSNPPTSASQSVGITGLLFPPSSAIQSRLECNGTIQLTETSTCWVQAILLPQPPKPSLTLLQAGMQLTATFALCIQVVLVPQPLECLGLQ